MPPAYNNNNSYNSKMERPSFANNNNDNDNVEGYYNSSTDSSSADDEHRLQALSPDCTSGRKTTKNSARTTKAVTASPPPASELRQRQGSSSSSQQRQPPVQHQHQHDQLQGRKQLLRRKSSVSEKSFHFTSGSVASAAVTAFSLWFPFALAPWAASETYHYAWYDYDPDVSHFDNTAWTYGTDYLLAACLGLLALSIPVGRSAASRVHAWRSRGLLLCYLLSVLAGGVAHQFYTTLEQRNTWHFRLLWTVCVGCVTFASAFMGSIGSELVRFDRERDLSTSMPVVPEWFWAAYGIFTTAVCASGGISFQRPACDIFIAGITQSPSTFYMMTIFLVGLPTHPVPRWTRVIGVLGFILNAPLLPMYPLLVQYTDWSLAGVNTLLHTWLLVAWGLQGLALRRIERSLVQDSIPPPMAIPIPNDKKRRQQRLGAATAAATTKTD